MNPSEVSGGWVGLAPEMAALGSYPWHGGQLQQISERFGIPVPELLDFSANINPGGPPSSVLAALRASLDNLSVLTEYPDLRLSETKQAIASHAQIYPRNIIIANGFVPLLDAVLRALSIRRCLLPVPAFVEYRKTLERAGVETVPFLLNSNSNFQYDPAAMFSGDEDAMLLANPQNPSGISHDAALMRDLAARAREKKRYVLLDEAFVDYVPEHSLATETAEFPNLIVFRSVTKFYGMPGMRVGYAVANPSLSPSIGDCVPPWPVTTLACRAVCAALSERPFADRTRAENAERRALLHNDLERLGFLVYPSSANFLLFRLHEGIDPDIFWRHTIIKHGIVLRACANYEGLADGHFRVAVRTTEQNHCLSAALAQTLSALAPGTLRRP